MIEHHVSINGIDVAAVTRVATALAGLYGISFLFGVDMVKVSPEWALSLRKSRRRSRRMASRPNHIVELLYVQKAATKCFTHVKPLSMRC